MKLSENRESLSKRIKEESKMNLGTLKIGDKFIDTFSDLGEVLEIEPDGKYIVQWLNPDVSGVQDYENIEEGEGRGYVEESIIYETLETLGITEGNFNLSDERDLVYPYEKWIPDTKLARKLYKIIDEDSGKVRIL
mgnify:CR=1 FL=1